jgi:hypothetical protein
MRKPYAPSLRRLAPPAEIFPYSHVFAALHPVPAEAYVVPSYVVVPRDPLRRVPRGPFTLGDYSYTRAGLHHAHFGSCALRNLGRLA